MKFMLNQNNQIFIVSSINIHPNRSNIENTQSTAHISCNETPKSYIFVHKQDWFGFTIDENVIYSMNV